jgi:phage shock protein PspC (stress-responsive transcriptional regulator)
MFSEVLEKENKQVIVEHDVNQVVEQMGAVADFESAEGKNNNHSPNFAYNTEGRRLFRDPDDHLVGGVCAGIANYFDINAVWVRLFFAFVYSGRRQRFLSLYYFMNSSAKSRNPRRPNGHERRNTKPAGY